MRRRLYRQLAVAAWDGRGISPVNTFVIVLILANLAVQVLSTEKVLVDAAGHVFEQLDWIMVLIFSFEYLLRVWVAGENPRYAGLTGRVRYVFGFFSLIDLIAIVPAYVTFGTVNSSGLRALRLLRVLRFARFGAFNAAFSTMWAVLKSRAYELTISVAMTFGMLLVASTMMFFAEGKVQPEQFGSIPRALWWAVVTMTTVGYGDTVPLTVSGKILGGIVQLTSIAVVALPTGIFAAGFADVMVKRRAQRHASPTDEASDDGR